MKTCYLIVGLAACGGGARPAAVVVATAPASTGECAFGGSVVSTGSDDNGNGMLDDVEIASRVVLCNDRPVESPPATVVRLVAEPAGAHCALAGTAVQSGPDRNRNGVLDDDEVDHIDYACGEPLLTRLALAPPDAQCVAGGVAFLAGRDHNHDGKLEDDEVEQRRVACGDELAGDIAVGSADDAAALAGIAVISNNPALGTLALPPGRIDGGLAIHGNPQLVQISASLRRRLGAVRIDANPQLTRIELVSATERLTAVGDVTVLSNESLERVTLDADVFAAIAMADNPRLAEVAMTGEEVTGDVRCPSSSASAARCGCSTTRG